MRTIVDGEAAILVDDSHPNLVIATWFGAPTEPLVRDYFAWYTPFVTDRLRRRQPFVVITDALDTGRPAPKARALIAELTDALPDIAALNVGNYLVVGSALVRGAITAMQWLSRKPWTSVLVSNTPEALRRGLDDLRRVGAEVPRLDPVRYRRPARP